MDSSSAIQEYIFLSLSTLRVLLDCRKSLLQELQHDTSAGRSKVFFGAMLTKIQRLSLRSSSSQDHWLISAASALIERLQSVIDSGANSQLKPSVQQRLIVKINTLSSLLEEHFNRRNTGAKAQFLLNAANDASYNDSVATHNLENSSDHRPGSLAACTTRVIVFANLRATVLEIKSAIANLSAG